MIAICVLLPSSLSPLPSSLACSFHPHAESGGDVSCRGGRQIVQICAAGAFCMEQRLRPAELFHFSQLLDLSWRKRAAVITVRALPASRIECRQPPEMHCAADRMRFAGASVRGIIHLEGRQGAHSTSMLIIRGKQGLGKPVEKEHAGWANGVFRQTALTLVRLP